LTAACRKVSRRAEVVRRKGNIFRKIRTQGNCGQRKELTAAGKKVTRCGGQNKDNGAPRSPKGRTFGKRRWKGPECNNGISDRDLRQQLRGSKRIQDLGGGRPLCLKRKRTTTDGIGRWSSGQRAPLGSGEALEKNLYEISGSKIGN
jgi:hypothetical protein